MDDKPPETGMRVVGPSLVAANVFEFNGRHKPERASEHPRQLFTQTHFALAGLTEEKPLVLLHRRPHDVLLRHWRDVLNYDPLIITCEPGTGRLCADALHDAKCLSSLADFGPTRMRAWGITPESAALERALGIAPCLDATWPILNLLNGKAGNIALVRDVQAELSGNLVHPMVVVDHHSGSLNQAILDLGRSWPSLIIKPGVTWGGKGTFYIDTKNSDDSSIDDFIKNVSSDTLTNYFVIEPVFGDLLRNVSPSYDWMPSTTNKSGRAYAGRMVMNGFRCVGTVYGKGALASAEKFSAKMDDFVYSAARKLNQIGYDKWFDVDFLSDGNEIVVNEINIRHTGGTVPILIANRLLGPDWHDIKTVAALDGIKTTVIDPNAIIDAATRLVENKLGSEGSFLLLSYENYGPDEALASIWISGTDHDSVIETANSIKNDLEQSSIDP